MFPPEIGRSLRETLPQLGMQPRDILRMMFGGGLGGGGQPPAGAGFDPEEALRRLLPRGR
jgi:hypothetical protein